MKSILFKKIEEILYREGINTVQFLSKTGFSKGMFYSIKNGGKTELSPIQVKTISDAFPTYDYNYFFGITMVILQVKFNFPFLNTEDLVFKKL